MPDNLPPSKKEKQDDFPDDSDFPDDDFIEDDFDDDEKDIFPDTPPEHSISENEIKKVLDTPPTEKKEQPTSPPTDQKTNTETENNQENEEPHTEEPSPSTPTPVEEKEEPHTEEPSPSTPTPVEEKEEPITSLEDIPFSIHIEVARIQMNYQSLCEIEKGQVLDLNTPPMNQVNLTLNEKIIGKGELIKIGETLGIRILEINE